MSKMRAILQLDISYCGGLAARALAPLNNEYKSREALKMQCVALMGHGKGLAEVKN